MFAFKGRFILVTLMYCFMVSSLNRRDVLKAAGAVSIVGLAGCVDGEGADFSYGVLMPETGDLGSLGQTIRDGAILPARQLDGETELVFQAQTGNTDTDPQTGISEANSMVDAGISAFVGPAASNVNIQVAEEVFIPNQVVGISPSSTAPSVTDLDDDGYIFRTCPSDALQGQVMADVAIDRLGASSASTLFLNDDYGQALASEFVTAFENGGGDILAEVSFESEQPSYSSEIDSALDDDPDVLMIVGFPESGIQLFRDFYDSYDDDDVDILVPDGLIDPDLPGEVNNDMENVIGTQPSADGPGADFFADLYEDEFGSSPTVFNGQAYDAAAVAILAYVAAEDDSGTAIRDEIRTIANPGGEVVGPSNLEEAVALVADGEEIEYQGASSTVEFDDNGDITSSAYDIVEFSGGEITVVDTITFEAE